jgi:hypothetical protein
MAKKTMSKAERVRKYSQDHPESRPKEVAAALEEYGITAQYVSLIRLKDRQKEAAMSAPAPIVAPQSAPDISTAKLLTAARLIRECGGIDQARKAIETVAEIAAATR